MTHTQKIVSAATMHKMDQQALAQLNIPSNVLMYNAAQAFYSALIAEPIFETVRSVLIVCGKGNNGGDGYALAPLLHELGTCVSIFMLEEPVSADAKHWYTQAKRIKNISFSKDINILTKLCHDTDMIIDAGYGSSFRGELDESTAQVFQIINAAPKKKVSIDIPTGLHADSATGCKNAFCADLTISFECLKFALASYPALNNVGTVRLVSIGFPKEIHQQESEGALLLHDPLADLVRNADSHKGTYGNLLMHCGSYAMTGAGYLSAMGALRFGLGLLSYACPKNILSILQAKLNEPVFLPYEEQDLDSFKKSVGAFDNYSAVLHGCGSGKELITKCINQYILTNAQIPCVLDADALNVLAGDLRILKDKQCSLVLTPHPKEMARLIQKDVRYVQNNRVNVARDFAQKYQCTVVLKGARTVIAMENGNIYINGSGNPGMSKGGSGDILAGMIASALAQGHNVKDAVCSAVYCHGHAGDLCSKSLGQRAMLPGDILTFIR